MRALFPVVIVCGIVASMLASHSSVSADEVPAVSKSPVHLAPVEGKKNRHKHDHVEPPAPEPDPLIDVTPEPIPPRPRPEPDRNFHNVKPLPPLPKPDQVLPIKPVKPGLFAFVSTWLWRLVLAILVGAFLCGVGLTLAVRRLPWR